MTRKISLDVVGCSLTNWAGSTTRASDGLQRCELLGEDERLELRDAAIGRLRRMFGSWPVSPHHAGHRFVQAPRLFDRLREEHRGGTER